MGGGGGPLTDQVLTIAKKLEALIMEIFPDAVRSKDKADVGFGFTKGYKGLVFVVSPQKTHVNLGVARRRRPPVNFPALAGVRQIPPPCEGRNGGGS
jgi:hypothetical protein